MVIRITRSESRTVVTQPSNSPKHSLTVCLLFYFILRQSFLFNIFSPVSKPRSALHDLIIGYIWYVKVFGSVSVHMVIRAPQRGANFTLKNRIWDTAYREYWTRYWLIPMQHPQASFRCMFQNLQTSSSTTIDVICCGTLLYPFIVKTCFFSLSIFLMMRNFPCSYIIIIFSFFSLHLFFFNFFFRQFPLFLPPLAHPRYAGLQLSGKMQNRRSRLSPLSCISTRNNGLPIQARRCSTDIRRSFSPSSHSPPEPLGVANAKTVNLKNRVDRYFVA